jgi:hypothetical protein
MCARTTDQKEVCHRVQILAQLRSVLGSLTPVAGLAAIRPSPTAVFKQPDRKPTLFWSVLPDAPASCIAFTHREMSERARVESGIWPSIGSMSRFR